MINEYNYIVDPYSFESTRVDINDADSRAFKWSGAVVNTTIDSVVRHDEAAAVQSSEPHGQSTFQEEEEDW